MYDNSTPINDKVSSVKALIAAINKFPQEWALTPCVGKRNLWPNWNKTKLDRDQVVQAIRSQTNLKGKKTAWTGVSLVTGPLSAGIMAIDFDGPAAWKKYLEFSSEQAPPFTQHWTSGKTGHFQILLSVPQEKWEGLKPQKFELDNGNKLELRWNQCSTLPPSIHPDTAKPYFWESEADTPIAKCPDFILDLMREAPAAKKLPQSPPLYIDDEKSLVEILEQEILPRLDAEEFYGSYLKLKTSGKNLKGLCSFHNEKTPSFTVSPENGTFHCFGCGAGDGPVQFLHQIKGGSGSPIGKDFYAVVMELADRVGVRMPDFAKGQNLKSKKPKSQGLHPQLPENNNVLTHPKFEARELSGLKTEVCQLLEKNLKRSDLTIAIGTLSQKYGRSTQEIRSLYQELEQELEQESDLEDTRTGIEQLLASKSASVKLSEIFPESLAAPIEVVANRMNLKPEVYALALISGISRFLKNGSSTMLVEEWNRYRCRTLGYFGAFIAEASQMKTPVLNAMIADPLAAMRKANQEKFKAQEKAYKDELEQWKNSKDEDKGPPPDAPVEKLPYITKATWEGISGMVGHDPEQGILWLCDELAGFFKSANQYRSGKGSDKEDLLECWSGNGAVVARAGGTIVNVGAVSLSIYGNIQPKVLAPFLGDGSDDNGTFARFDFVQQPPALTQITLGLPRIDINPMLQALYENVDALPVMEFELDQEAKELFVDYYNHCQKLRISHPKQGMRAMLGKAAEKVGRVATILHCIHAAHLGNEVSQKIPAKQVAAAIKWVEYTTQQALSINIEVCSPDALESNLAKIISLAEQKGGTVTARDILITFDSQYRPTPQTVQEWFASLQSMKYGEVTQKGRSIRFCLQKSSTSSTLSYNLDAARITNVEDNLHTTSTSSTLNYQKHENLEINVEERGGNVEDSSTLRNPYADKDISFKIKNVENVEDFAKPAETSQPSMLSCTTPPSEFAEQIRKAIANFDRSLAIQVWDGLKAKVKRKLREEVKSHLTPAENENFKLLVAAGFLQGTRVKYVGDPKYAEQYEGLELEVYSIDEYFQITCRKPNGAGYTTRLKPEELEIIS
ncbi:DUF3987 domain-containing protein [Microcoleus sp. AR_TQ3_B6]|uniref:DUF3987 domain-containing protein n=1 Tax=Microcoleus sp. AR_TQ3_B6 TaxID=3055284 RepID=UPI002FD5A400